MEKALSLIIIFTLLNIYISYIPNWNLEGEVFSLFSSDSQTETEFTISTFVKYSVKQKIIKNNDGTFTKKNYLYYESTFIKEVDFEEVGGYFENVNFKINDNIQKKTVICPKGSFHPYFSDGTQISVTSFTDTGQKWDLKCFHHGGANYFLAFYKNKGAYSLNGYHPDLGWEGTNHYQDELYGTKIQYFTTGNEDSCYPIIYFVKDGDWLKLIGGKQYLKSDSLTHTNVETRTIAQIKTNTAAYFNNDDDTFYYITYNTDSYSIGYSTTTSISNYANNDKIKNVQVTIKNDLTFNFIDDIEIEEMNFIRKTQKIFYKIKSTETDKTYYGIMDMTTQKILFNTDENIEEFKPISDYEMLVITSNKAYKICIYKSGNSCQSSCPDGTSLVVNTKGNECLSNEPALGSEGCKIQMMTEGYCIDSCDTTIFIEKDNKCGLCSYFYPSQPYKLKGSSECLDAQPDNSEEYKVKYYVYECKSGYQQDTEKKTCIPHCHSNCKTCNSFQEEDTEDQDCIDCKDGYQKKTDGTNNCEEIPPTQAPTVKAETEAPTVKEETEAPTVKVETEAPTEKAETEAPTEKAETEAPTVKAETEAPTVKEETEAPTVKETEAPTVKEETEAPTVKETEAPTVKEETEAPTAKAETEAPTVNEETEAPTVKAETQIPSTEKETDFQTNCNLEKCKTCSEESLKYNLCISCNELLGYKPVNYTYYHPEFLDCKKQEDPQLNNYYFDTISQKYKPCYRTCKKCSKGGDSEHQNCIECEANLMFRPGKNPDNNCVVFSKYYYLDAYNQYKSMDNLQCIEEAKYLVKEKNYCIYDCKAEKDYKFLYNGNCIESCPEGTTPDTNNKCKENPNKVFLGVSILNTDDNESSLKVVKTLARIYASEYDYTDNHVSVHQNNDTGVVLFRNQQALNEVSLDMPKVNMDSCSEKVKETYGINKTLISSVIEKRNKSNHETFYSFFHPDSGEKLEAEAICQNETIEVKENITSILNKTDNINFKLQISLVEQGINIFDLNDPFYKDICYDFDNPGKRDIALRDRVKQAYPNAILCEEGCRNKGINLGDMTATCDCTFRDITHNSIVKENEILDSFIGEFFDILDDSNIMVVKCYKYIIKYFLRSYGGIATTIIIGLNLILTIIFFSCEFNSIKKYAVLLTKNYLKLLDIYKEKYQLAQLESDAPESKEVPPKRKMVIKEKREDNQRKISNRRKSKRLSTKLPDKEPSSENIKVKLNKEKITTIESYRETQDILEKEKKLKSFYDKYLTTSPDEMEFDDAIKKDERSFCKYFSDNLKKNQLITNTFIASDSIKKRSTKLILFNLNLVLYIVVNGLFFSEVYISELFNIKEEDENFFSFLPRSIDRLFYATIVSVIISYLVDCFFIEEEKFKGIFKRERLNPQLIKKNIKDLINEIKKRYISFIILVFVLLLCFLYYLLCFNYVYPKSQMEWIKSSIAIIIIINILSVLKIFIGAVLRYLSFCCENEYIFKFSRAFS